MQKPRVKRVFPPLPAENGIIQIGGIDYGIAAEIQDDEQGHMWHLLALLDGNRTQQAIIEAMQAYDPILSATDIEDAIAMLIENGYLEDAELVPSQDVFSTAECERYRRNFEFFSHFHLPPYTNYDFQERLKRASVTVLGIGGLGSFVSLGLAAIGIGHLHLIDDDTVELCNLNRQVLYTEKDLGHYKCEVAVQRLREINPHITVTMEKKRISSIEDGRRCMAGQDFFVCAADRPRVRIYEWLNKAALAEHVPWMRGANDGLTVNMFLHVPQKTACFECEQLRAASTYSWYRAQMNHVIENLGDRTINPCTAPIAGIIGNLAAWEIVKFLTGIMVPASYNRKMIVNLRDMEISYLEGERQVNCPACGNLVIQD